MALYLMLKLCRGCLLGKASYRLERLFLWVLDGGLEMGQTSRSLKIGGCQMQGCGNFFSPGPYLPRDATMDALIDGDLATWNFQLIEETFLPFDASRIKAIPLCSLGQTLLAMG